MTAVTKKQIEVLIDLQKTELETRMIQASLDRLPEEMTLLENRLEEYKTAVEDEKTRLSELQTTYRSYESNSADYQAQIAKSQEKLKAVKTNKEYQSGLKEIEEIEELISKLEDKMIGCLEDIDTTEQQLNSKSGILEKMKVEVKGDQEKMSHDSETQKKELNRLKSEMELMLENIDPGLLKKFKSVQSIVGDIALAGVSDAVCQVCNVNLPPQMYNELLRVDKLLYCPHCQRIIYPMPAFTDE